MKKQKTQSKLIVALTSVILLLVALSATLTFAYFTASQNSSTANLNFGTLSFDNDAFEFTDGDTAAHLTSSSQTFSNLVPGCTINLGGSLGIKGNIPAFVRIGLSVAVKDADNENAVTVMSASEESTATNYNPDTNSGKAQHIYDVLTALINTSGNDGVNKIAGSAWLSHTDGYLYLNKAVTGAANDGTTQVMSLADKTLAFAAANYGNTWKDKIVVITFSADAIQAEHLTSTNGLTLAEINALTVGGNGEKDITLSNLADEDAWDVNMSTGVEDPQQQQPQQP